MSIMPINRIKYLREELEAERISTVELAEIQEAYHELCTTSDRLTDEPENALASDMLNELEASVSPVELSIYDWVVENFSVDEANDPSWTIGALADHLLSEFKIEKRE